MEQLRQKWDEEDLVRALARGDRVALRWFYEQHHVAALRWAARMLRHPADAEDAVHDAFVTVQLKIGQFSRDTALAAWFFRILTRTCLGILRKRGTDSRVTSIDAGAEPLARPEAPDLVMTLDQEIERLSDRQRMVFVLSEVEGFALVEVAQILDIQAGTARYHLHEARQTLRKRLSELRPVARMEP